MTIFAFTNPTAQLSEEEQKKLWKHDGKKPHYWLSTSDFKDLENLDKNFFNSDKIQYFTIQETFWKDHGYSFTPGVYEGEGFRVEVSLSAWSYRGGKEKIRDSEQEITARFDSIEIAIAFWKTLTNGDILPTRPLCRELSVTEQVYAKQAAAGVAAMARVEALEGKVAMLMNQVQGLAQLVQDRVLTPNK